MKLNTLYKKQLELTLEYPGNKEEAAKFIQWCFSRANQTNQVKNITDEKDFSIQPLRVTELKKSVRKLGHRAKKRTLNMSIHPNSGLPLTLHASLASLFDNRKDQTPEQFISWFSQTKKEYDPEMFEIYQKYPKQALEWVSELAKRRES